MVTTRDRLERKHHQQARTVGQQDERKAWRAFVEAERRDGLLLQIRGSDWHSAHKLSETRLPADLAIHRSRLTDQQHKIGTDESGIGVRV